jgi:uncharacterized protein YcbK (DUF882 family)
MKRRNFLKLLLALPTISLANNKKYQKIFCDKQNKLFHIPINDSLESIELSQEAFKDTYTNKTHTISRKLIQKLYQIQIKSKKVIHIISAYRTSKTNKMVNGAKHSFHKNGKAVDIYIPKFKLTCLHSISKKVIKRDGGVGIYYNKGFIHIDVRGYPARWSDVS